MELPPLAVLTPEIVAGTELAVHEIKAPGVADEMFTNEELVPEQIV